MRTALTSTRLERTLTELDHVRLTRLLQRQPADAVSLEMSLNAMCKS